MANVKLSDVQSGYNRGKINDNFKKLEQAINEETLQRDGSKDLKGDMNVNGKRLYNLAPPVDGNDALTLAGANFRFADKEYVDTEVSAARSYTDAEVGAERSQRISADTTIRNNYKAADDFLQAQISGGEPLQASAFSPISWHDQVIVNSVTIPANKNAWSFGPTLALSESATVTLEEGSFWTISNG